MSLPDTVHASAALVGEIGILIRGASGSGKSSLLLELIRAEPASVHLVADDRVVLRIAHGRLLADAPPGLAGLVEVRGLGLVKHPHVAPVVIRLIVDLVPLAGCPRLPEQDEAEADIGGLRLPRLFLPAGTGGGRRRIHAAIGRFFAAGA
jgi:HPr kinase/phosphorylase